MPNPTLTPVPTRRRPTRRGPCDSSSAAKKPRPASSKVHHTAVAVADAATATPPPPTKETTKTTTTTTITRSSSEKETPTVIFTTQSPHVVVVNAVRSTDRFNASHENDEGSSSCHSSSSSSSSDNDDHNDDDVQPLTHQQAATNMLQTTLECGIASLCRLRKLFPRHFFSKMDVEGTSVTRFDVGVLEECAAAGGENGECPEERRRKMMEGNDDAVVVVGKKATTTLSPLTATQKTFRTAVVGDGGNDDHDDDNDDDAQGDGTEARRAIEALLLLRWIGTNGVHSMLKRNKLARVILGIMVPKKKEDELVEQYVFEFGCNQPLHPNTQLALTQARQNMSSFFQNLNGYSAGRPTLSQAVVPMMTQGTSCSKSCGTMPSQLFELQTQQSFDNIDDDDDMEDESGNKSRCSGLSQKQKALPKCTGNSSHPYFSSQKSIVESMTQSIKASVKRHRGIRIPPSRYLTLRIEFTESIATSDLPEAWKDKNHHYSSQSKKCVSPIPAKAGFVITPLGTVAEENCTGLSVAMTAYSKGRMGGDADCVEQPLSQQSRLESTSSQFEIDELVLEAEEEQEEEEEEEGFKPFTQMD
eukprot:CCRYP_012526-RA/>CCRYP_012526-RA protein AED:0.08 eAED:0.08 QI:79/1/1/1/1/0.5/2/0/586